jgi:hypothetical protein
LGGKVRKIKSRVRGRKGKVRGEVGIGEGWYKGEI